MPLAIDLFCGLGGWAEGLLAEGWDVVGFDIERHQYGEHRYPATLVIQDVLTLHGSQFRDADLIVASPPCQFFSYTAMPWTRAKALAAEVRADPVRLEQELALFRACFRIQREASEAAGHHVPMVVENVRGAIPWVGRSRWNFGSYHLWGDVPALMPMTTTRVMKFGKVCHSPEEWVRVQAGESIPHPHTAGHWASPAEHIKAPAATQWFNDGPRTPDSLASSGGKSPARKMASAMIAKIPLPLARHIGAVYRAS